jgi:hypothetical protein
MPSFFSVIRFVPSSVTNEAINVGVLLASGDHIEVRALEDWQRVRPFAGQHWKEVRRLIADMAGDPHGFLGIDAVTSADGLREQLSRWTRVIQFSDVHASLASMGELANTIPQLILGEGAGSLAPGGRRNVVIKTLYQAVVSAYSLRFDRRPLGIIQKQAIVPGRITKHKVDVGIVNGRIYAGAFALSFATAQTEKQWRDTDAVAFAVDDMMSRPEAMTVVLDAPAQPSEPYVRAQAVFKQLGVPTIAVDGISEWATRAVTAVPDAVAH